MNRLVYAIAWGVLAVSTASTSGQQPTWGERLGYPPEQRVVIIHADDMGAAYEFHQVGQQGLEINAIQSAAVLVPGPWFPDFATWRRANPQADVGISLSFVAPSRTLKWGPVTPACEVPSLVTPDGYFPGTVAEFTVRAEPEAVRREAERQIERARAMGLRPTHLLPHMGTLFEKPELLAIYFELAEKYWIPAVMVEMSPPLLERFRSEGRPIREEVVELIGEYRLPKIDNALAVQDADTYEAKRAEFFELIEQLPPGITQVFMTPAQDSPALRRMTRRWQNRVWEARLLKDPEVDRFLQKQDLVFTDWVEIMRRFEASLQSRNRRAASGPPEAED